ncbi:MAG: 6,7-dimethyl-8-ribityllumazine synthase [Chitinophagaceae bacterium]|nr:6,7-dimethyl-8-ribityllumazine synthase [Chitinophagaceae bacterium]
MAQVTQSNLLHNDTGILNKDACIVIVKTEWNAATVGKLEDGCRSVLAKYGIWRLKTITVPGAFEIPFSIKAYWDFSISAGERPDAFIALGCVIRGGTPHFDYVCKAVTDGVLQLNLSLPVPTIFGVLTLDSQQQADERTGGIHGHKGEEAAMTALKMINLKF